VEKEYFNKVFFLDFKSSAVRNVGLGVVRSSHWSDTWELGVPPLSAGHVGKYSIGKTTLDDIFSVLINSESHKDAPVNPNLYSSPTLSYADDYLGGKETKFKDLNII